MKLSNQFMTGILIGVQSGIIFFNLFGKIAKVEGISMQPTLNPDNVSDYVFLNHFAIYTQEIRRGEIITCKYPKYPTRTLIKRVVGLPGDIVRTRGAKATTIRVPEGHYWIEGDHIDSSLDSNNFGPISSVLITAKATLIVWPPSRWQFLYPTMINNNFQ